MNSTRRTFLKQRLFATTAFASGAILASTALLNADGQSGGGGDSDICTDEFTVEFFGEYTQSRTRTFSLYKNDAGEHVWVAIASWSEPSAPSGTTQSTFDIPGFLDDGWDLNHDGDDNDLPAGAKGCRYHASDACAPVVSEGRVSETWDAWTGWPENFPTFKQKANLRLKRKCDAPPVDYTPDGDKYATITEERTTTWSVAQVYKRFKPYRCTKAAGDGAGAGKGISDSAVDNTLPSDVKTGALDFYDP